MNYSLNKEMILQSKNQYSLILECVITRITSINNCYVMNSRRKSLSQTSGIVLSCIKLLKRVGIHSSTFRECGTPIIFLEHF